jgi:hypothetical protein
MTAQAIFFSFCFFCEKGDYLCHLCYDFSPGFIIIANFKSPQKFLILSTIKWAHVYTMPSFVQFQHVLYLFHFLTIVSRFSSFLWGCMDFVDPYPTAYTAWCHLFGIFILFKISLNVQNRCGFEDKGEIWVKDILNLGVS